MVKSSKEKAVEILNNTGFECTYDKDNDDIRIWNTNSNKIDLYFMGNLITGEDKKLSFSISSSNGDFKDQKNLHSKVDDLINALEKIKKIDSELIK